VGAGVGFDACITGGRAVRDELLRHGTQRG
jgi:hypothetical protein